MLRHAQASAEPVYWDDIAKDTTLTPRERAFVTELRSHGLSSGVGIPVYGPNGQVGHCGLGFRAGVRRLAPEVLRAYQWVCQLGHLRYCDMLQADLGPPPALSGRESEVLALVARGKSNGTIGQILGISSHTVDAHLRRIYAEARGLRPDQRRGARHRRRADPRRGLTGCGRSGAAERLAAGEGPEVAAGAVEEGADAVGVVQRQGAQPPADGLLDEPLAVGDGARRPAEDALAGGGLGGIGVALPAPRQGGRRGRRGGPTSRGRAVQPATASRRAGSATRRRSIALQAWSAIAQASKSGPRRGTRPRPRLVLADAGLGQELGCGDAGLVDVAGPEAVGEGHPPGDVELGAPGRDEGLEAGQGEAEVAARGLVVGRHLRRLGRVGRGPQGGEGAVDGTVTRPSRASNSAGRRICPRNGARSRSAPHPAKWAAIRLPRPGCGARAARFARSSSSGEGDGMSSSPFVIVAALPLSSRPETYSTVTDFAKLRGWSTSVPLRTAVW